MGLTKQYLRYVAGSVFNVIGSGRGGCVYLSPDTLAVAAVGSVTIWDVRRKEKMRSLVASQGKKLEVTCMKAANKGAMLAVGYSDGSIRIFDTQSGEEEVTFTGHKTAVTCLAFDKAGLRLVSGSRDTTVVVWDVVGECGVARLAGHKGPVTAVSFLETRDTVVSASKDTFVKFWDLATQHCFKTLTGHLTEVWGLVLVNDERHLVTGGVDSELRVWGLSWRGEEGEEGEEAAVVKKGRVGEETAVENSEDEDDGSILSISRLGSILRKGEGRVQHLVTDLEGRVVACHGTDNLLETFVVCSKQEVEKRLLKKAKKMKRTGEEVVDMPEPSLQEMVKRLPALKTGGKVKSVDLVVEKDSVRGAVVLGNNMVEQFVGEVGGGVVETMAGGKLEIMGHRSDVRSVAFSSDNTAVATGSSECVKVWNRNSQAPVRTMPSSYVLSLLFCPGDRHLVAATKSGKLELFNLGAGELTESIAAHEGEVWAIVATPDKRGFVTGGADKTVKFWDFELVSDGSSKVLSAVHKRTLSVDEGVTAVSVSSDGRLVAVALLDSTVKVFFVDTLKFFLSLYGHKLPVVSMDISTDSSLIVTGSADRNMKIWGLDFGDCHKSIFSHDDTVTGVRWLPDTHMLASCGKDGELKMWDGDTFNRIQTMSGHVGEVWGLAVSPNGKWLASCGKDRSVRLWEKTSEVLVLDDERETERDEQAESEVGQRSAVPGEEVEKLPSRRTAGTERGAESLMEALDMFKLVKEEEEEGGGRVTLPPLMVAYGAESALDFVCGVVGRLKPADLEEILLVLPLNQVKEFVAILADLLEAGKEVEVVGRCLLFLLEIHHGPIINSEGMEEVLGRVNINLDREVGVLRDRVGTNLAGLRHLADKLEASKGVEMFTDATTRVRERNKKKKKKEKSLQRAIMSL